MSLTATKTLTIVAGAGTVTLDTVAVILPERLSPRVVTNFIDIAATTNFASGTFTVFVEYVENGGFAPALVQGAAVNAIDASDIGSLAVDGDVKRCEVKGNVHRIKVVAASISPAADTVTIVVSQARGI
jgi:hypothetical protein